MKISTHFTLDELFVHCTVTERKQALTDYNIVSNLIKLAQVLQEVRSCINDLHRCDSHYTDIPLIINSCYRDVYHNRRVGGVDTSDHLSGSAVDIYCKYLDDLQNILLMTEHYQVIRYDSFLHYSLPRNGKSPGFIDKRTKK